MSGIEQIAAERKRQIQAEDWTPKHDDQHMNGELALVASCYAHNAAIQAWDPCFIGKHTPLWWPKTWSEDKWEPSPDPIRNLEKAGALMAREIDRLERLRDKGEL